MIAPWALSGGNQSAERFIDVKTINFAVALVVYLFSATALAQTREDICAPDVYEAVQRHLKIDEFAPEAQDGGNVISAVCRIWPYKPNLLLAAFAYDEGVESEKQLIVLILDAQTKRVISSFRRDIYEDAVTEVDGDSLKLDTARYRLSEDVRAFGVIFNSSARGASCGEEYWDNDLTLFVPEGKNLLPIANLDLYYQRWLKGCPANWTQPILWEDAVLTIRMGKTRTNGLFDLAVTAKITVNSRNDASTQNLKDRVEHHTLRYDGKFYRKGEPGPWWLPF